jgi:V/A-type H+-transporting ATPase subunit D
MKKTGLTKTQLKKQKDNLKRYNRYLPILDIKKKRLQKEIERVSAEIVKTDEVFQKTMDEIKPWAALFGEDIGLDQLIALESMETRRDNIAGTDIPVFVKAHININQYDLFEYHFSILISLMAEKKVLEEQKALLSVELRITSQRVNLFEAVKIPETKENIRRIMIFFGDQEAAAFGWAKTAKKKLQRER